MIQTLSGCYTGEFPHLPVPGTGRSCSLHGGRKDLISLRDLRRQPRRRGTLAPQRNSNDLSSKHNASTPSVRFFPLPTGSFAHQKDLLLSSTGVRLHTSSESLASSATDEGGSSRREEGDAAERRTQVPTEKMEAEEQNEGMEDLNFLSEEEVQEKTLEKVEENKELEGEVKEGEEEEGQSWTENKEDDADEVREVPGEGETWCGCRAFGKGLRHGTVHEANTFVIDTSEAEQGEVSEWEEHWKMQ